MKIVTAAQQKGGVGKTATIVHLAYHTAESSRRVLVVDLDPQANTSHSMAPYTHKMVASELFNKNVVADTFTPLPGDFITLISGDPALAGIDSMDLEEAADNFSNNLLALSQHFDVCFIDTAPALGVRMTTALYVAHAVYTPIEMSVYSLQGVELMKTTIEKMYEYNPDLKFLGLLPSRVDRRIPTQIAILEQVTKAQLFKDANITVIPTTINLRSTVAEALDQQVPVWKIKKSSARVAAKEMRKFAQYVLENVGA